MRVPVRGDMAIHPPQANAAFERYLAANATHTDYADVFVNSTNNTQPWPFFNHTLVGDVHHPSIGLVPRYYHEKLLSLFGCPPGTTQEGTECVPDFMGSEDTTSPKGGLLKEMDPNNLHWELTSSVFFVVTIVRYENAPLAQDATPPVPPARPAAPAPTPNDCSWCSLARPSRTVR